METIFFLHIFPPGRALHHQGSVRNGTEHLISGNSFNFMVTCIVGNLYSYCFPNLSFVLAQSQTRFRKSRFIWKCTFFYCCSCFLPNFQLKMFSKPRNLPLLSSNPLLFFFVIILFLFGIFLNLYSLT